ETGGRETAAVSPPYVPHVVAWNLTRRCNLECAHCYISAGPHESATSELDTTEALRIVDELLAVNPAPLLVLSGGGPVLRADLARWQRQYRGQMMVRAKCAPHFMRHVHASDPESPILNYETRCPCGTQYCRITPDGKLTPCPYLPEVAGDLRTQSFGEIWRSSPLFRELREGALGGKCGRCEYQKLCGGCRARAFALEGDVLAADPSCVYEPA